MRASDVIDAIAVKYSSAVLLREVVVGDPDHDLRAQAWLDSGQEAGEPYPNGAFRRIDALMLEGGSTRTAIEVKVTRSDFFRDTEQKRAPWERITDRFVYACPAGLIDPTEVPPHCGLWWIDASGRVTVKSRSRKNRAVEPLPHQLFVAIAYRLRDAQHRVLPPPSPEVAAMQETLRRAREIADADVATVPEGARVAVRDLIAMTENLMAERHRSTTSSV